MSLTAQPLIPMGLWLLLAALTFLILVLRITRRPIGINRARWYWIMFLSSFGASAALALLLNPTRLKPLPPPPGKPLLQLLVDASASMGTTDVGTGQSRFDQARARADQVARSLADQFDVDVRAFDSGIRSSDLTNLLSAQPTGDATDVGLAIASSLASSDRAAGQAVVLFSDGIHNTEAGPSGVLDAARAARTLNVPVFTSTFGQATGQTEARLELRSAQDLAVLNQKVPVTARIRYRGVAPAQTTVRLTRDGKEIASQPISLRGGTDEATAYFVVESDHTGVFRYDVAMDAIKDETTTDDNRSPYVLRVVDEPIRALVLEGKPYWDGKFLLQTLAADPAVAVDALIQVRSDRVLRRTLSKAAGGQSRSESNDVLTDPGSILADIDSLKAYQVVLIGRDAEAFLTPESIDTLKEWISRRGGSLVCYRGSPVPEMNSALASLLPIRWTASPAEKRFHVALTDTGKDMRWTLDPDAAGGDDGSIVSQLPTLATSADPQTSKPLAIVLATTVGAGGRTQPVVTYQPFGSGRVVVIEGAGMWRWTFLQPSFQQKEVVYASLWQSLLRWLTSGTGLLPGQQFNLRADKVLFDTEESASCTLLVRSEKAAPVPAVLLRTESAEPAKFVPAAIGAEAGVYRISFGQLPAGRYTAEIEGLVSTEAGSLVAFEVRRFGREMFDVSPRPDLMARIAELSGGAVLGSGDGEEIQRLFLEHRQRSQPATVEKIVAWDRGWVMTLIVGVWLATWLLRRRSGLT